MALALLDTTVLIDVLRGAPAGQRVIEMRESGDVPCACAINVEEVVRGLRARETAAAEALFKGLRMLPLGRQAGWFAGEWRRAHAERGCLLAQADCLIAAAAHVARARLCTGNPKDFPIAELTVEHWAVGE